MAGKSKIDEDCEELSVVADPWNLKLKPAKLKGDPFLPRCEDQYCPLGTLGYVSSQKDRG
ncbi:hypothetical protein ES703_75708 [subsurface metagenome]